MHEELIKRKNWCIEMSYMKADSSKRMGRSNSSDETILGVEGNFKKLNFDWNVAKQKKKKKTRVYL